MSCDIEIHSDADHTKFYIKYIKSRFRMACGTRLFVGNLPDNTQEEELLSAFSGFGKITNLDLKSKAATGNDNKKFAFISISALNMDIESCITYFSNEDFNGHRLYVTRARESFLERLQRERSEVIKKETQKGSPPELPKSNPILHLSDKLNPKKRKINDIEEYSDTVIRKRQSNEETEIKNHEFTFLANGGGRNKEAKTWMEKKKYEAEQKRIESMKKKRQEFKEKKMIIKKDLTGIDKVQNKKIVFDDYDEPLMENTDKENKKKLQKVNNASKTNTLFDDDIENSDDELNFEVKKQFEGKKGQKVLDLQSRYKSDKRFTLDERFIDEETDSDERQSVNEEVELDPADEKVKQLNILQDVLGVTLKAKVTDSDSKKTKPKLGMLRFDPMQPDHVKYLAPIETKPEPTKKSKKKLKETEEVKQTQAVLDVPKVEVSKEKFYKVSDTLKEAIAQPNTFSLRSLFGQPDNVDNGPLPDTNYIPLEMPKSNKKVKHPLDRSEKNPFVYDSSDSETEEPEKEKKLDLALPTKTKAVWKENLFFCGSDTRLKEGLIFFSQVLQNEQVHKERRQLKSLVKKRLYNNDRKNQMFKKKIGGRKKSMKKPYINKNKK